MRPSPHTSVDRGVLAEPSRAGSAAESGAGRSNLTQRVLSAIVFVPGVLALAVSGRWTLLALVLCIAVRSAWEWCYLSAQVGYRPNTWLALVLAAGTVGLSAAASDSTMVVYLFFVATIFFAEALLRGTERYTANALLGLGAVLYAGLLGSAPLSLVRVLGGQSDAYLLVGALFMSIWLTDALAYFSGRQWGQKKLAPTISPQKTVVGFLGGLVGAMLPLLLSPWLEAMATIELAGLFMLVGVGGQVGDLVESAVKRDMGNAKDAPALIPGHGGMLDRFDSYFFAFPLAYIYAELLIVFRAL